MITVPVGDSVTFSVPYVDDSGNAVAPTAAVFSVLDADGNTIQSSTAISPVSGTSGQVSLSSSVTSAPGGRVLVLQMTTAAGIVSSQTVFVVMPQAGSRLVILKNTLQTLAQAAFTSMSLHNVPNFLAANAATQELALIEAFRRLTLMNYYIPYPFFVDWMEYMEPRWAWHIEPRMWPLMTADLYAQYPAAYHQAMLNAQVVEANAILTTSPAAQLVAEGMLAWTVGESKMMFKPGLKPLKGTLSRAAMSQLQGWLNNNYSLTRS